MEGSVLENFLAVSSGSLDPWHKCEVAGLPAETAVSQYT